MIHIGIGAARSPMTSRERVLCALNHEEPDRVPIFSGTSGATTMHTAAYDRLKARLGLQTETRSFWRAMQYAVLDEEVMARFHSDGRPLIPGPAPSTLARDLAPDAFVDAWGITWQYQPGHQYFDITVNPLRDATIDDLGRYAWPVVADPSRFAGLKQRARAIREAGQAVVALSGISPFEFCYMLRGMDAWFLDLASDHDFVHALMRKLTDLMRSATEALLAEAGEYIDVLITGDDLGSQHAPLLSPATYRKLIKPYHAELFRAIKARSKARIFYHSDGNVYPLLNDLIEIGIDLLNPVQVSAKDMGDTARLKREFGDRLAFCGAIDSQWVLPHGTPGEVRCEVRRRIKDLAPGGGYILASVHCIQPDVPSENVCAMFDEAVVAGRYPLAL
jgi:uroporphyrinogen decarboxylase